MGVEIEGHRECYHGYCADSIDTETGPGVFETALAYTDADRMADNALLFKLIAKSMGMKHNVMPSFMAKPWENVSWAQKQELTISALRLFWTHPRVAPR